MYPSLRLLSSFRISSTLEAFAMAALTFSASSFDISRPALIVGAACRGSSIINAALVACVFETVVEMVVASAVGRFSAVTNNVLPAFRSYVCVSKVEWLRRLKRAPCPEFSENPKLLAQVFSRQAIRGTIFFLARGYRAARDI